MVLMSAIAAGAGGPFISGVKVAIVVLVDNGLLEHILMRHFLCISICAYGTVLVLMSAIAAEMWGPFISGVKVTHVM